MNEKGMKILITGASSYVGARLYADICKEYETVGTYFANRLFPELIELDITKSADVSRVIEEAKPDWIVHVVANPNARWCEANPDEAKELNEKGTQNIVDAANKIGAGVIYISSSAAIVPANVYAKSKLVGEEIAKKAKAGWLVLRPALIVGYSPNTTNDRPYNRLLKNLTEKTPAIYDTSWKCQPTYLGHISEVILGCLKQGAKNETIPICVSELKTRFDLAKDILEPFGIKVEPKDDKDETPVIEQSLDKLRELGLPVYSYEQIIEKIVKETKEAIDG